MSPDLVSRRQSLRVLLAVPWYFPDSNGGTEVYVRGLAQEFLKRSIEVAVAAPAVGENATSYVDDGVRVFRYPAPYASSGEIDISRPEPSAWGDVLDNFSPTVVDFHSLTSGLELAHLKAARRRGMRTVVTFHIPGIICARGTFMRFGTTPCEGDIDHQPCTACRLEAHGLSRTAAGLVAAVPPGIGRPVSSLPLPATIRRVLRASSLDEDRQKWLTTIFSNADRVVAPSDWLINVLVRNRVPRHRLVLCRQGVDVSQIADGRASAHDAPLRVGFLGRYDPVKGLHVLVHAVNSLPESPRVELHVWGIARSQADEEYQRRVRHQARGDSRIVFHDESRRPVAAYAQLDVLAVPSLWLETGPLVVLEAQAAGLPVVGSNLGGIAERVRDGVNGVLVPPGDPRALSEVLHMLATDRAALDRLRPIAPPRTTSDVAQDTLRTYETLLAMDAA